MDAEETQSDPRWHPSKLRRRRRTSVAHFMTLHKELWLRTEEEKEVEPDLLVSVKGEKVDEKREKGRVVLSLNRFYCAVVVPLRFR